MNDKEWKLKITEELAVIKTDVKHILMKIPNCQYPIVKKQLDNDKKLLFLILASYVPMIIGIIIAINK